MSTVSWENTQLSLMVDITPQGLQYTSLTEEENAMPEANSLGMWCTAQADNNIEYIV